MKLVVHQTFQRTLHFLDYFKKTIINIHPSILPKYGGKGMYGSRIHDKVIENNEVETGITIHYVSEKYDSGEIIFQKNFFILEYLPFLLQGGALSGHHRHNRQC